MCEGSVEGCAQSYLLPELICLLGSLRVQESLAVPTNVDPAQLFPYRVPFPVLASAIVAQPVLRVIRPSVPSRGLPLGCVGGD